MKSIVFALLSTINTFSSSAGPAEWFSEKHQALIDWANRMDKPMETNVHVCEVSSLANRKLGRFESLEAKFTLGLAAEETPHPYLTNFLELYGRFYGQTKIYAKMAQGERSGEWAFELERIDPTGTVVFARARLTGELCGVFHKLLLKRPGPPPNQSWDVFVSHMLALLIKSEELKIDPSLDGLLVLVDKVLETKPLEFSGPPAPPPTPAPVPASPVPKDKKKASARKSKTRSTR